ncbi:MAG: hypothetical protein HETSPECPRED_007742 [Heterodermia speciosa]|uniref:Uncharacterized protein n=1 Tax=Heterodermia speciosa TaxID=116794 RepID=A0A8H3FUE8_9LECA|nr:MAG: hypothetical protein HETSPECPRED_007742 [Heterodermia speciosa]
MSAPARPYLSNGQVLQRCLPDPKTSPNSRSNRKHPSPPLSARLRTLADHSYNTLGLYVSSLFSLDAYAAAEASQFNVNNRSAGERRGGSSRGYGGSGGGTGGGGGSGPGSGGSGGKKLGRVDDIRGPECKSCQ